MRRRISPLLVAIVVAVVGAGLWMGLARPFQTSSALVRIGPKDPLVGATDRERRTPGATVRHITLTAAPTTIQLGSRRVATWAFNGTVPGPEIRLRAGDVLHAVVKNRQPAPLTIHWHGIALRNDMDGVPGVTQQPIKPGGQFVYEFTAPDPGTYFYHPHTGTQLDRGLYAPLIVEDPSEASERDLTFMLDDWIDGTGETPDDVLAQLRSGAGQMQMPSEGGMPTSGMGAGGATKDAAGEGPLGDDTGDVNYPLYLINGRPPTDPATYSVRPGERLRIRLINAASDTPFRVALGGSRLTVVASDGYPVQPVIVDSILIGMGERYDVVVTVPRRGVFPVVAVAEGKGAQALAVLRAGPGPMPMPDVKPAELGGKLLGLADLHAIPAVALPADEPDRTYTVALTGDMATYRWGIDVPKDQGLTLPVREGERVRLVIENRSMMWHPIHLHGQTFQVITGSAPGPRKDTVIVPAMGRITIEFIADNPGQWALHCHNIYHAEVGMVTVLSYVA